MLTQQHSDTPWGEMEENLTAQQALRLAIRSGPGSWILILVFFSPWSF